MMIKCILWLIPCLFVLNGLAQKANYKEAERFMRGKAEGLVGSTKVRPSYLKKSDKSNRRWCPLLFRGPESEVTPGII